MPVVEMKSDDDSNPSRSNLSSCDFDQKQVVKRATAQQQAQKTYIRVVAEEHRARLENSSGERELLRPQRSVKRWSKGSKDINAVNKKEITQLPKPALKWIKGERLRKEMPAYHRVHLAIDCRTGDIIAATELDLTLNNEHDAKTEERLTEEMKSYETRWNSLTHDHIVEFIGIEKKSDLCMGPTIAILTEYVPGGSVFDVISKHGALEENNIRLFAGHILAGLEYLHRNGIALGILGTKQVLVSPSGICKINVHDPLYAFTSRNDGIPQESTFYASPDYICAARTGELSNPDNKADIWSLGCIVLEMITGLRPWNGINAIAVTIELFERQRSPPCSGDGMPFEGHQFLEACFALDGASRPSTSELETHRFLVLPEGWSFTGINL